MAQKKSRRTLKRQRSRHRVVPGAAPGQIRVDPGSPPPTMTLVGYGPQRFDEQPVTDPAALPGLRQGYDTVWLHVTGLGDAAVIKAVGAEFGLHSLALEDVVNQHQRPKFEDYQKHLYVALQAPRRPESSSSDGSLALEQVNVFWGRGFVVTFADRPCGCWDGVRARLREGRTRIRGRGPDYLAYALVDAVVDRFFPLIEEQIDRITDLEDEVLQALPPDAGHRLAVLRHEVQGLRRVVAPLREALGALHRDDSELITEVTRPYLRDALDHGHQLADLVDTGRDLSTNLMNLILSVQAHRSGDIMRVLTIIATLFIPLTFVVGIYGMNFAPDKSPWNMPELQWRYGYPAVLGVMALIAGGLLLFFRRRGWLGR
jgi:magnesium transporter